MVSRWERDLLAGVPAARIVELAGANLYMFLSNEADVLREAVLPSSATQISKGSASAEIRRQQSRQKG